MNKDLSQLVQQLLPEICHGGVNRLDRQEERRIARLVTNHIPDHASLFMNFGTITEEVARILGNRKGLRVITNSLNIAEIMSGNSDFEVIIAGGVIRPGNRCIIGQASIDFIHQFRVDFSIIGISGIESDGALLNFDFGEARIAKAMIANSRQIFVVAAHRTFGCNALVRLGHLSQVHALFTSQPLPKAMARVFAEAKTAVYVANSET